MHEICLHELHVHVIYYGLKETFYTVNVLNMCVPFPCHAAYPTTLGTADSARGTEVERGDKCPVDILASCVIDRDSL